MWDDNDKPKRLSLRERMALKENETEGTNGISATPFVKTFDKPIKKYRQSREMDENDKIEVSTKRRVVRFNDDGEEEVSVRDRNLSETKKEEIKRDIARMSQTFESLAEEDDSKKEVNNNSHDINNNNIKNTNNKKFESRSKDHSTSKKHETYILETNGIVEESISEFTIETSINGGKKDQEITVHERTITKDGSEVKKHETTRIEKVSTQKNEGEEKSLHKSDGFSKVPKNHKKEEEVVISIETKDDKATKNLTAAKKTSITDRFTKNTADNSTDTKNLRNRSEKNNDKIDNALNKSERTSRNTRPSSMVDFKSKFENKDDKVVSKDNKTDNNKKTTIVLSEEEIVPEETVNVESAKVEERKEGKVDKAPTSDRNKRSNDRTDRFEKTNNNATASKRPQSMADFKSKFESKNNHTSENAASKSPVTMNIRSKFESGNTTNNNKPKFELKKTVSDTRSSRTGRVSPQQISKTVERKVENHDDEQNEVITTKIESVKGKANKTEEIEETKTVEVKDTAKTHSEKTTTVTNIKTAGGTVTVQKTETRIETKPEPRKVTNRRDKPRAPTVQERLREQKKKQEVANASKGRNIFKLQLEANTQATLTVGGMQPPKTPTGNSNIDKLLKWIAKRVNKYPAVNVTNYTSSWADGIALCALMNYMLGDEALDPLAVSTTDRKKNFEMAINAATANGVPALLDATELAESSEMDRRSMITYLHTVYKVLFADKQDAGATKK